MTHSFQTYCTLNHKFNCESREKYWQHLRPALENESLAALRTIVVTRDCFRVGLYLCYFRYDKHVIGYFEVN